MKTYLKINKFAVKFIPELDELNQHCILVMSINTTPMQYLITNEDTYTLLKFINDNTPTMSELLDHFDISEENTLVIQNFIDMGIIDKISE